MLSKIVVLLLVNLFIVQSRTINSEVEILKNVVNSGEISEEYGEPNEQVCIAKAYRVFLSHR